MGLRRPVLPESLALATICTADMISTLYLVRGHLAVESNPVFVPVLAHSDAAFLVLKALSYLLPIAILEGLRGSHPAQVRRGLRTCLVGYVALYALGSLGLVLLR